MQTEQLQTTAPDLFSRCGDSNILTGPGPAPDKVNLQMDASIAREVDQALWENQVLRAMDYYEVDVRVQNRVVILNGHITSSTSNDRVEKAIKSIPLILGLQNHLVLDDQLTTEVASALANLEHLYECKFFTGVTNGVVTLHGNVKNEIIKSLAGKCVAENSNVRGVINCVRVLGVISELQETPVYQPAIGQEILFQNGVSGIVRQVIINPDNRRVTAMLLAGRFTDQLQEFRAMSNNEARPVERQIIVSVDLVRYLTKFSGFLTISSNDGNRFADFDASAFRSPDAGWVPPYPYCPRDVLFNANAGLPDQAIAGVALHSILAIKIKETLEEQNNGQ